MATEVLRTSRPEAPPRAGGGGAPAVPELVIEPAGDAALEVRDLWQYRSLLYFLIWRDLRVRYTQTVLGVGWAVLQPLLSGVMLTLVFGRLVGVPSDGIPYAVFVLAAIVPWTFVSGAFSTASASLLNNTHLISKVYFPRLVIPFAPVGAALVDLAIGLALVAGAALVYHVTPTWLALVVVPASMLVFALTAAGAGCWVAALSVQFRDVKHLLPLITTLWLYASPVVYPISRVPHAWRPVYALNPLAGTLEGFRAVIVGRVPDWALWGESSLAAVILFVSGALYFRRAERFFADIV